MSLKSLYSGFKFLDDNLLKPTKSLFQQTEKNQPQTSARTKANSSSESISPFPKLDEGVDKDLWEEGLDSYRESKQAKNKTMAIGRSSTTIPSHSSPIKPRHGHTKSLLTMAADDGIDSFKLHDGSLEVFQSSEAPLLFAKGGYDQHVSIPKNSKLSLNKKSVSQSKHKGGFIIIEDNVEDPIENHRDIKIPQLPINSISSISSYNHYDTQEEMSNFLAGKLDFNRATKPMKSQPVALRDIDTYDPLDSARSIENSCKSTKNKFGKDHRRISSNIISINDPLFGKVRPMTTKAKTNFSVFSENTPVSTAMTWERAGSCGKNGGSSNFDNSPTQSKHGSVIILEDQTSELDFDLGVETDRNLTVRDNKSEEESQPADVRTKLIEEFKAMKSQQLCLKGIYVIPSESPFTWNCLIFVKGGYYEKGKFKFQVQIPQDYPTDNIKVYSLSKVYHPLINIETGEVDLKLCDQTTENKIEQVLLFLKSIFNESKYLEKVNSFNHEAGSKFNDNPYYFKIKAKESVKRTEKNNLNEKENILPTIQNRVSAVRDLVKNAATSSNKFDVKVQSLIENITKNLQTS